MTTVELPGGLPVAFRERLPTDEPFIFSSWLRTHHRTGDWPGRLGIRLCAQAYGGECAEFGPACPCCKFSHRRYFDEHKLVIGKLLERSRVLVACNPEKAWQVLGYIVYEQRPGSEGRARDHVLHWVFVKEPYRWDPAAKEHPRLGTELVVRAFEPIVRDDIEAPLKERICHPIQCSHWTMTAERLRNSWWLVYRPFLLEEQ
jgi:hypothetical protein